MKLYILVTGLVFALLVLAHIVRVLIEGWHVLADPAFLLSTLVSLGLSLWAVLVYRQHVSTHGARLTE